MVKLCDCLNLVHYSFIYFLIFVLFWYEGSQKRFTVSHPKKFENMIGETLLIFIFYLEYCHV